mmetsp:Transcript_12449/g.17236  ORF Transcript_12449/g.17236 Transcript_12449/m.17236 type:complete len:179 (+) Transcript_12449:855-1391(+)
MASKNYPLFLKFATRMQSPQNFILFFVTALQEQKAKVNFKGFRYQDTAGHQNALLNDALGCEAACPYCSAKCSRPHGHNATTGDRHATVYHHIQGMRGWRDSTTNNPTEHICTSTTAFGCKYQRNDQKGVYIPFADHIATFSKDWAIAPEPNVAILGKIQTAWNTLKSRFCTYWHMTL